MGLSLQLMLLKILFHLQYVVVIFYQFKTQLLLLHLGINSFEYFKIVVFNKHFTYFVKFKFIIYFKSGIRIFKYLIFSRKNPFGLLVAPNKNNEAFGYLFWDDGDSLSKY